MFELRIDRKTGDDALAAHAFDNPRLSRHENKPRRSCSESQTPPIIWRVTDEDEIPEFESKPCPKCGGAITVVKMDFRFAGRYTCPHCGSDVLFTDETEETS